MSGTPPRPPRLKSLVTVTQRNQDAHGNPEPSAAVDRTTAIIWAAEVDLSLEKCLTAKFGPHLENDDLAQIFGDQGGFLNSFGSKVRLGYALGLFGPLAKNDLTIIGLLRNAFAHSTMQLSFENDLILQNCLAFRFVRSMAPEGPFYVSEGDWSTGSTRSKFVLTAVLIMRLMEGNAIDIRGDYHAKADEILRRLKEKQSLDDVINDAWLLGFYICP